MTENNQYNSLAKLDQCHAIEYKLTDNPMPDSLVEKLNKLKQVSPIWSSNDTKAMHCARDLAIAAAKDRKASLLAYADSAAEVLAEILLNKPREISLADGRLTINPANTLIMVYIRFMSECVDRYKLIKTISLTFDD